MCERIFPWLVDNKGSEQIVTKSDQKLKALEWEKQTINSDDNDRDWASNKLYQLVVGNETNTFTCIMTK